VRAPGGPPWPTPLNLRQAFLLRQGLLGLRWWTWPSATGRGFTPIERPWGGLHPGGIEAALLRHSRRSGHRPMPKPTTGVLSSRLEGIGELCRRTTACCCSTVTSLGAGGDLMPGASTWAYSCSQERPQLPPRLGPFSNGAPRRGPSWRSAMARWPQLVPRCLPAQPILGSNRVYHHTGAVNMNFGMREACVCWRKKGLENAGPPSSEMPSGSGRA